MKTSLILKTVALLPAVGYPVVAFAEFLGARIPAAINAETSLAVFAAAIVGLTLMSDYGHSPRRRAFAKASVASPLAAGTSPERHSLAA